MSQSPLLVSAAIKPARDPGKCVQHEMNHRKSSIDTKGKSKQVVQLSHSSHTFECSGQYITFQGTAMTINQ